MATTERVIELVKKIASDDALRERLAAANDAERLVMIEAMGFGDVTPADVAANAAKFAPQPAGELSDQELAAVAGGWDTNTTVTTTTTTTATASASAAVAT